MEGVVWRRRKSREDEGSRGDPGEEWRLRVGPGWIPREPETGGGEEDP